MSRRKGSSFENLIAKRFTEVLGFEVRRTPRSGAYGGEGWSSMSGDIMFAGDFEYYVELKNRESWKLEQLFNYDVGEFWSWAQTTWDAARENGKKPMLIFKRNHVEPLVALDHKDVLAAAIEANGYDCLKSQFLFACRLEDMLSMGRHNLLPATR